MAVTPIKFGTDGWRAIIADDYTLENVKRVAEATALWMKKNKLKKAVIGHDCRFGGKMFADLMFLLSDEAAPNRLPTADAMGRMYLACA